MCSSLTSFPGFFRYHLPFFQSIASRFSSTFKSLRISKLQSRSTKPRSGQRLATEDVGVTLGSRIDGKGRFLNSGSLFPGTQYSSTSTRKDHISMALPREYPATRRDYYEEVEEIQQAPSTHWPTIPSSFTLTDKSTRLLGDPELGTPVLKDSTPKPPQSFRKQRGRFNQIRQWYLPRHSDRPRSGYWDILSVFRTGVKSSSTQQSL